MVPIRSSEEGGEAQFLPSYYLREWEEAQGILQHINLQEGSLTFEGFIVRIPPSLSVRLSSLHALIGQNVSIIRTDSANPIIVQAGDYRDASPASSNISPPRAGLTKIPRGATSHGPRETNAPETYGPFD